MADICCHGAVWVLRLYAVNLFDSSMKMKRTDMNDTKQLQHMK